MKNADKAINPITELENGSLLDIGLTKREYFAAMAMQGLIGRGLGLLGIDESSRIATESIYIADELLKQLDQ